MDPSVIRQWHVLFFTGGMKINLFLVNSLEYQIESSDPIIKHFKLTKTAILI